MIKRLPKHTVSTNRTSSLCKTGKTNRTIPKTERGGGKCYSPKEYISQPNKKSFKSRSIFKRAAPQTVCDSFITEDPFPMVSVAAEDQKIFSHCRSLLREHNPSTKAAS